jgi:hypothetical protein
MMTMDEDNAIARMDARKNWENARQGARFELLTNLLPSQSADLLSFDEVQERLRLSHKTYRGIQEIHVDRIIGSVGRYRDFTRSFLPRNPELRARWQVVDAVVATRGVPPIEVYQVGEAYFVLDGNHRVSVARQSGAHTIEAHVWEFQTPAGLSANANLDELLIKEEYAQFLERTKLDILRSETQIIFTAPGRYREIELQIELYREILEQIDREPVSYEEAVTAWYDMVYTPATQIIREQGILERFPERTEADLFVWIWRYNEELHQRDDANAPVHLSQVVEELVQQPRSPWEKLVKTLSNLIKPGS